MRNGVAEWLTLWTYNPKTASQGESSSPVSDHQVFPGTKNFVLLLSTGMFLDQISE